MRGQGSLWRDSLKFDLPTSLSDEGLSCEASRKPVKSVRFGKDTASLALPYLRYDEIKDLSWLYSDNFDWFARALALPDRKGTMKETGLIRDELFVLDGPDGIVRGTYHKTYHDSSGAQQAPGRDRVGMMFLNGLSAQIRARRHSGSLGRLICGARLSVFSN